MSDKKADMNIVINLDIDDTNANANKHIDKVKENIEQLINLMEDVKLPDIHPVINFYGCSFNFANEGCADSRYYGGDDIYIPRKEI